jgi:hypothetical protein
LVRSGIGDYRDRKLPGLPARRVPSWMLVRALRVSSGETRKLNGAWLQQLSSLGTPKNEKMRRGSHGFLWFRPTGTFKATTSGPIRSILASGTAVGVGNWRSKRISKYLDGTQERSDEDASAGCFFIHYRSRSPFHLFHSSFPSISISTVFRCWDFCSPPLCAHSVTMISLTPEDSVLALHLSAPLLRSNFDPVSFARSALIIVSLMSQSIFLAS